VPGCAGHSGVGPCARLWLHSSSAPESWLLFPGGVLTGMVRTLALTKTCVRNVEQRPRTPHHTSKPFPCAVQKAILLKMAVWRAVVQKTVV
jgi:hypothetical protein